MRRIVHQMMPPLSRLNPRRRRVSVAPCRASAAIGGNTMAGNPRDQYCIVGVGKTEYSRASGHCIAPRTFDLAGVLDAARRTAARSVNSIMTAAYWLDSRLVRILR